MDFATAFDRLEAFSKVQLAQCGGFTLEAVACLQEAVGLNDQQRRLIAERLPSLTSASPGAVMLGVMLALFASQPEFGEVDRG